MNIRILVVDDDKIQRIKLKSIVSRDLVPLGSELDCAFEYYEAHNGKEAVERAMMTKPHIVLMDIMMPVMDGLAASEQIKASDRDKTIALLSSSMLQANIDSAQSLGLEFYIVKAETKAESVRTLESILRRILTGRPDPEVGANSYIRYFSGKVQPLLA
ncbi:MAG: response regulator [Caldilineaceae bacterium]|nr:response regulator [Caldilineaceae bacterium]